VTLAREHLTIPGPAGPLEVIAGEAEGAPEGAEGVPQGAEGVPESRYAVVCHPHPLYGGTMDNKVVYTVARALESVGIPTLRFNFRGVGRSEGVYDGARGETDDAAAVAEYGASRWPERRLVLAGFSFGSYVALRLAAQRRVSHLITVAPPVARFEFDFSSLGKPGCPWLLVQGDADELVDPAAVIDWARSLDPQPRLAVVPGVGHFFHGHLAQLREIVRAGLRSG
jgi:alpha/beta superfamily hydrolase